MISFLLDPKALIGAALGAVLTSSVVGGWAVLSYGPAQYKAGGIERAAELDAATQKALKELSDEADRADFLFAQCNARLGVYDFTTGKCVEGFAD